MQDEKETGGVKSSMHIAQVMYHPAYTRGRLVRRRASGSASTEWSLASGLWLLASG